MTDNEKVYSLEYNSIYSSGTMLFHSINTATYWTESFLRSGNVHITLRKLCKRHAAMNNSLKFGKCCKILRQE